MRARVDDVTIARMVVLPHRDPGRRRRLTPLLQLPLRRVLRRSLGGRRIDPGDRSRGRFAPADLDQVLETTLRQARSLWAQADLEGIAHLGNRMNVALAAATIALYRALLDAGVPAGHAADLTADAGWRVYDLGSRPVVFAARLAGGDAHHRMVAALRLLLRFPFAAPGRPGYEVDVTEGESTLVTTWTWCPPLAFVRQLSEAEGDRGELEAFRRSWCSYDWAFNDLLAGGSGAYRRPHTMSDGDEVCDMTWAVSGAQQAGTPLSVRAPTRRSSTS